MSINLTTSGAASMVPTGADCAPPEISASVAGAPAVAVSVRVVGIAGGFWAIAELAAVTTTEPAVVGKVYCVTTIPLEFVTAVGGLKVPAFPGVVNVMETPGTG